MAEGKVAIKRQILSYGTTIQRDRENTGKQFRSGEEMRMFEQSISQLLNLFTNLSPQHYVIFGVVRMLKNLS
jgi:hypothetical protein